MGYQRHDGGIGVKIELNKGREREKKKVRL